MNNEQVQLLIAARRNIKDCVNRLKADNPSASYNIGVLIDELNEMQHELKIIVNSNSYARSMRGEIK